MKLITIELHETANGNPVASMEYRQNDASYLPKHIIRHGALYRLDQSFEHHARYIRTHDVMTFVESVFG